MAPPWQAAADGQPCARRDLRARNDQSRTVTHSQSAVVRHPAGVIGRWQPDPDGGLGVPGATATSRGPEHRVAALTLAALLVVGGLMGTINLFVDGVLRDGAPRWVYGATMAAVHPGRGPAGRPAAGRPLAHVRAGPARRPDLPRRRPLHRGPGPLRHPADAAVPGLRGRLVPGPWELGVNMVVTTVVCLVALWPSYDRRRRPRRPGGGQRRHAQRRRARRLHPAPAGAAAARRDADAQPTSTRSPACSTAGSSSSRRRACGGRPAATAPAWPRWCSTSTTSSGSTTRTATPPGDAVLRAVADVAGGHRPPDRRPGPHRRRGARRPRPGRRPGRGARASPSASGRPSPTAARPTGTP